jgi:hypothetical protein
MRCNKKQKSGEMVKKKKQDCCKQESDAASSDGHIKNENKVGLSLFNMRQTYKVMTRHAMKRKFWWLLFTAQQP